jgi:hypothetical protein
LIGPAIIEEPHSTLYLPADWILRAAPNGDLLSTRRIGEA